MSNERVNRLTTYAQDQLEFVISQHLDQTFPALAAAVIQDGQWILNETWGFVDPEARQIPVSVDTLFDLASVSKLFTTTAFLSVLSKSDYDLDMTLVSVIPEFGAGGPRRLHGGQDPHSKAMLPLTVEQQSVDPAQITFRQLLMHTSGLAPWRQVYLAAGPTPAPPKEVDPVSFGERWANALKAICGYPFVALPGEAVRYSDLGLMLLGEATVRLHPTAENLSDVIKSVVTGPLSLATVMYNPVRQGYDQQRTVPTEDDPEWRRRRPWGEVHDENACGIGGIAGHAGLFANAADVARFGLAWLNSPADTFGIAKDIALAAIQEQVDDAGTRRGLGWSIKARQDSAAGDLMSDDAYGHLGFTGTSLWVDPTRKLVIVCLTNRVYPGRDKLGIHAFRRAFHDIIVEAVDAI